MMSKLSKLRVIKKDGRKEPFNLLKLKRSIELTFTTSGIDEDAQKFVDDVINDIIESGYREIKSSGLSDLVEKAFVSKLVSNPELEKAAKVYVLARIYNEVYGKKKWKDFDSVDMGFTYPALRVLYQRYLLRNHKTGKVIETPKQLLYRVANMSYHHKHTCHK
jgi:ribonucleoside-diphosphate reductase alpha chain